MTYKSPSNIKVIYPIYSLFKFRGSKQNLMRMGTNFLKFFINDRNIDQKLEGIGAIFMRLQPIHLYYKQAFSILNRSKFSY